jgi:general secretion pathway protein K
VISVAVANESGKVDLNSSQPELVEVLVNSVVSGEGDARAIASRILKIRQPPATTGAGVQSGGVTTPLFRSVMELERVEGLQPALFGALWPLVTVHSGSPGVNPLVASEDVLKAISGGTRLTSRAQMQRSASAFLLAEAPGRTFLIESEASTPARVSFSRNAVVEFTPGPPISYSIREWREGARSIRSLAVSDTPPC